MPVKDSKKHAATTSETRLAYKLTGGRYGYTNPDTGKTIVKQAGDIIFATREQAETSRALKGKLVRAPEHDGNEVAHNQDPSRSPSRAPNRATSEIVTLPDTKKSAVIEGDKQSEQPTRAVEGWEQYLKDNTKIETLKTIKTLNRPDIDNLRAAEKHGQGRKVILDALTSRSRQIVALNARAAKLAKQEAREAAGSDKDLPQGGDSDEGDLEDDLGLDGDGDEEEDDSEEEEEDETEE